METLIELLDTEPINYSQDGNTLRFWNVEADVTLTFDGHGYSYATKERVLGTNLGEVEVVAMLGRSFNIEGLYEDYRLLLERNSIGE